MDPIGVIERLGSGHLIQDIHERHIIDRPMPPFKIYRRQRVRHFLLDPRRCRQLHHRAPCRPGLGAAPADCGGATGSRGGDEGWVAAVMTCQIWAAQHAGPVTLDPHWLGWLCGFHASIMHNQRALVASCRQLALLPDDGVQLGLAGMEAA